MIIKSVSYRSPRYEKDISEAISAYIRQTAYSWKAHETNDDHYTALDHCRES